MNSRGKYLRYDEFVPFAPEDEGRTVSINHCKPGRTNARLYITRKDNGILVAYCHHCGQRGSYSEAFSRVKRHQKEGGGVGASTDGSSSWLTKAGVSSQVRLPGGFNTDPDGYSKDVRRFLKSLSKEEIAEYKLGYNGGDCIIPFYKGAELEGYLIRTFDSNRPKYISRGIKGGRLIDKGSSTVCICEDWLSAICIARYCNAYALLGAHINDVGIAQLVAHNKVIVFLDDDKPDIKLQQVSLKKRLQAFDIPVEVVRTGGLDPKEVDLEPILGVMI